MKNFSKKKFMILTTIAIAVIFVGIKLLGANNIDNKVMDAGYGLEVTKIESYSGPYMEDGSNEEVSNVLMVEIQNNNKKTIQYGEIRLSGKANQSPLFRFSTLGPGEKIKVLESTKMEKDWTKKYDDAVASRVAFFQSEPKMYEEKLKIDPLNGGFNITNISEEDINGEIVIYFKNVRDNQFTGGITYRGRISNGLKAGKIRQVMSSNFTKDNTQVVFVTIDGK